MAEICPMWAAIRSRSTGIFRGTGTGRRAVTGLGGQVPALAFRQAGHWVYNSTVGTVFHVDGGSKSVDARMPLPGVSPENQVLQDDQHGYVVDRRGGRVLVFGKSDLSVDS